MNHAVAQGQPKRSVASYTAALNDSDAKVRSNAARALGAMDLSGQDIKDAVPALIASLKDPDIEVRSDVAYALSEMGQKAKAAVPVLISVLKDKDAGVRRNVTIALGEIGKEAKDVVPTLIAVLNDEDAGVRSSAAHALGQIGKEDKDAAPALITALKDPEAEVRSDAARALGLIGKDAKDAVPSLIKALKDPEADVRGSAVLALGGKEPQNVLPVLIEALKDSEADVRENAAIALGAGKNAKEVVPALIEALKDPEAGVRLYAACALSALANRFFNLKSTETLPHLKLAYDAMKNHPDEEVKKNAILVKWAVDYFESLQQKQSPNIIKQFFAELAWWGWAILVFLLVILLMKGIYFIFLLGRPAILLQVNIWLDKKLLFKPKHSERAYLGSTLLLGFAYHPRLLDTWVRQHLMGARENFKAQPTVKQHPLYVPTPLLLDAQECERLTALQMQPIFEKAKATVLLSAEGGAGKSSLACQMGLWAMEEVPEQRLCKTHLMIPVLIEGNLKARDDKKNSFFIALRTQLSALIDDDEPLLDELANQLLKKSRVLVIVDSLSELDEATQTSIRQAQDDFLVGALIVTTRNKEEVLGGTTKTIINPPRLKGKVLTSFLQNYLCQRLERDLSEQEDLELFAGCKRLSEIIGEREITVLIAKMYAEQMLAAKLKLEAEYQPRNLPELMKGYINTVNSKIKADLKDSNTVLKAAKVVARESLRFYSPKFAKIDEVSKSLAAGQIPTDLLKYLQEKLSLLQTNHTGEEVKFFLDPLAEYLAAISLIEQNQDIEKHWKDFFDEAKTKASSPEGSKGYLEVVLNCVESTGGEFNVPDWVRDELALLVGRDPEAIKAAQLQQRIQRLIENLRLPDAEDRLAAIKALGGIGSPAQAAFTKLAEAVNDRNQEIRINAAIAVFCIDPTAHLDIDVLIEAYEKGEMEIRHKAAIALGNTQSEKAIPSLCNGLYEEKATPEVLCEAASALGKFGAKAIEAKYDLFHLLSHENAGVRQAAVYSLGEIGSDDEEVINRLVETIIADEDVDVCDAATWSLGRKQSELGYTALYKLYKSENSFQRRCAVYGLEYFGAKGSAMILEALTDEASEVRNAAVRALGWMENDTLQLLTKALENENFRVCWSAICGAKE